MDEGPLAGRDIEQSEEYRCRGLVGPGWSKPAAARFTWLSERNCLRIGNRARTSDRTIWEVTQYLIRTLDQKGESGAAALLHKVGGLGETARDLALPPLLDLRTQEMGRRSPGLQRAGDRLAGTDKAGPGGAEQTAGYSTRDVLIEEDR